jgi:uncharacterized protein YjdB
LIVSDPVLAAGLVQTATSGLALSSSAGEAVTYVSLAPGTVPTGSTASIRRVGSAGSLVTRLFDGGFDPVPVNASAGDSIEVLVQDAGGATIAVLGLVVAARRPPIVVRTDPPRRKTDVPLNAAIIIVFSEPIDGATLTPASIRLLQGQTSVSGTVRFLDASLDASHVSVEFAPDAPLSANTEYQLVVTKEVRDLDGEALLAAETVTFTTGQSSTGPPASLSLSPGDTVGLTLVSGTSIQLTAIVRDAAGNQLTNQPVTWSSDNTTVATVSSTGLVHALTRGFALVSASAGSTNAHLQIFVNDPPTTVTLEPSTGTIAVGLSQRLTATVRDSLGRPTIGGVTAWSLSDSLTARLVTSFVSPNVANVVGLRSGTTTVTATYAPGVAGTATFTVVSKLASLALTPDSATFVPSSAMRLAVTFRDSTGGLLSGYQVAWASNDTSAVAVDSTGVVEARRAGAATISATSEGVTGTARIVVAPANFVSVSAGWGHTCGLTQGGAVYCWGENAYAALGLGDADKGVPYRAAPVPVSGDITFAAVATGGNFTCGVATAGPTYCWGIDGAGQLGRFFYNSPTFIQATPDTVFPSPADGVLRFSFMSLGNAHTCSLTIANAAYCWGWNGFGQLGDGETITKRYPVAVLGGYSFATLSAGSAHTCGVITEGAAYCWGLNDRGQLGDGTTTDHSSPIAVLGPVSFAVVSAGGGHSCGLTADSTAYCWGANEYGQLGDGSTIDRTVPVVVSGELHFAILSSGRVHTCGVTDAGAGYCWGQNGNGQLGDGTTTSHTGPVPVGGGLTFRSVSAGRSHTCGITTLGVVYCWGANYAGALGDGTTLDSPTPVKVLGQP